MLPFPTNKLPIEYNNVPPSPPPKLTADRRVMMTSRACTALPELEDFGQLTSVILPNNTTVAQGNDQYQNILLEQFGFDPIDPSTTIDQLKALKQALCNSLSPKVENSSQYANPDQTYADMNEETPFVLETVDDIDQFLKRESKGRGQIKKQPIETETPSSTPKPFTNYTSKDVHISETPRVKVIAEKYTRFKKNNIELRKLEEKIVCIEYDVYDQELGFFKHPVQVMRAFFSITTSCEKCEGGGQLLSEIPPAIKNKLQIDEEELKKLSKKEIEMIDEKISENKPYLDDLRRVLKKQRVITAKKKKSTLDLLSMYDMARKDYPPLDHDFSNTNLLSKAELQEIKDLILAKCESGAIGISRRTVRRPNGAPTDNMKSDSAFYDILRDCASNM
ncbi:uncharacterized protein LOC126371287 [Pectinophora gossypiella]|uniref:uncharacterized protein LOC126371287 n=1 Tax=Pectinophora gossypiella TaxID=13191 RepID=UPI00214E2099|nr:uncharacterized protein LOC126371287 [Pectinophora gossypiella]